LVFFWLTLGVSIVILVQIFLQLMRQQQPQVSNWRFKQKILKISPTNIDLQLVWALLVDSKKYSSAGKTS
jgi:hypothetical protein